MGLFEIVFTFLTQVGLGLCQDLKMPFINCITCVAGQGEGLGKLYRKREIHLYDLLSIAVFLIIGYLLAFQTHLILGLSKYLK